MSIIFNQHFVKNTHIVNALSVDTNHSNILLYLDNQLNLSICKSIKGEDMQNNNMNLVWAIMIIAVLFTLTACSTQPNFTQEEVEEAILALENKALGYWSAANPAKFSENFSVTKNQFK